LNKKLALFYQATFDKTLFTPEDSAKKFTK